ncbi:MAG: hypothetical protein QGH83_01195 [Candidatus Pacebacteria bacterium]|nr:hypothetical protein [Candidatus Paceibacterota bacterium]
MMKTIRSKRSEVADRIRDKIIQLNLVQPYGGEVLKKKRCYSVLFCKPVNLDGVIEIYSPKWIRVSYRTRFLHVPHNDNRVFTSEKDVVDFLNEAFVNFDEEAAMSIPIKG